MTKRASLDQVLEFANKIREAGGGNPIDALMPSVPGNSLTCLIARNLNFNCQVMGIEFRGDDERWAMFFDTRELRDRVASALGLSKTNQEGCGVVLPKEIGQVAADFDKAWEVLVSYARSKRNGYPWDWQFASMTPEQVEEFLPYIEQGRLEAYHLASSIDDEGKIVI